MTRCFIAVLGIAWGCGGQLRAHAPGADTLAAIRIDGNQAIGTGSLAPALALHETARQRAAIDPYLLAADTERIRIAYWKRGYFEAQVAARVERRGAAGGVVVFTVVEGRRAVTRVEIAGLPPEVPLAEARALVALRDGGPFDYEPYDAAKLSLKALVENAGYARAELRASVTAEAAATTAAVRYEVVAGARCRFGAIRFAGTVRPQLLAAARARLAFATGDRYSVASLEESRAQLYELGRFSSVRLVPDRDIRGDAIDVTVELSEANRREVHLGVGVGVDPTNVEVRGRAGFSWVPASQPLVTAALDARGGATILRRDDGDDVKPRIRLLGSLARLDVLRPRVRGELAGGFDYQTLEAYRWTGEHIRLGLGSPLGRRWLQLHLGWRLDRLTFSDCDPVLGTMPDSCRELAPASEARALGLTEAQLVGAYQAQLIVDRRDNPIDPHRGVYVDLRAVAGTPAAGGDLAYLQLIPELRGYVALAGAVLAGRARVGAIVGDVPVTERYYSGGTSGQRGFPHRRLSPIAAGQVDGKERTVAIGGAGLIETSLELRRQLGTLATWPIGANLFLDGGDVTRSPEELDPWKLYWAVGAGVWTKPVGDLKLRVDIGYRVNRRACPELALPCTTTGLGNLAWHIGFGESY